LLVWWDPHSGKRLGETHVVFTENDRPMTGTHETGSDMVFSSGLRWLASLEYNRYSLLVWDSLTGEKQYRLTSDGRFTTQRISPDEKLLAFGMPDGTIRIVDTGTGKVVRELAPNTEVSCPKAFLDGGRILVSDHDDDTSRFWDLAGGHEIFRLDGHRIEACSRDGRYAASISVFFSFHDDFDRPVPASTIFIWDLRLARNRSEQSESIGSMMPSSKSNR